jgi:S1-C subfamily serine protease
VIPAATIDRVAAQLEAHGRIARGYLGLGLHTVAAEAGGTGAMVMSVDAKGARGRGWHPPRGRSGQLGWQADCPPAAIAACARSR